MLRSLVLITMAATWAQQPLWAQDKIYERVEFRVTSTGPGATAIVDRGKRDMVEKGDILFFYPRKGGTYRGVAIKVSERSAVVELHDKKFVPPIGTPGEIPIPKARIPGPQKKPPTAATQERPGQDPKTQPGQKKPPTFRNKDPDYQKGMPLLAGVKPVRPEQRDTRIHGRFFTIGDITVDRENSYKNSFLRVGTDLLVENPFGRGGGLSMDAEFDYRTEQNEIDGADLLVRRFSYYRGGTRFSNTRWEVGRFLQHGMPEFQVLDGVEWNQRRQNGDRYGVSFGLMPEPDDDFDTGQDLQFAAHYHWVVGQREELTISGGLQKTFHNGKVDRDLIVAKVQYLPLAGWNFHSTLWIDYYYGPDAIKGHGFEVTQAMASLSRSWDGGNGVDLTYRRLRFPELLRNEYRLLLANDIADNRYDSLTFTDWLWMSEHTRFHNQAAVWEDETDSGGSAELGFDVQDFIGRNSRTDLTFYGALGQYTTSAGGRLTHGRYTDNGRWDVLYELGFHHNKTFPSDRDDILQHRVRGSRSFNTPSGWDCTFYAEGRQWDSHISWSAGFYLQRSF